MDETHEGKDDEALRKTKGHEMENGTNDGDANSTR